MCLFSQAHDAGDFFAKIVGRRKTIRFVKAVRVQHRISSDDNSVAVTSPVFDHYTWEPGVLVNEYARVVSRTVLLRDNFDVYSGYHGYVSVDTIVEGQRLSDKLLKELKNWNVNGILVLTAYTKDLLGVERVTAPRSLKKHIYHVAFSRVKVSRVDFVRCVQRSEGMSKKKFLDWKKRCFGN